MDEEQRVTQSTTGKVQALGEASEEQKARMWRCSQSQIGGHEQELVGQVLLIA